MLRLTFSILITIMLVGAAKANEVNCAMTPPLVNISACCAASLMTPAIGEKCIILFPPVGSMSNICFGECVFNETGLAVNGAVQMDKAKAILSEKYQGTPGYAAIVEQIMVKCERSAKEKLASKASQPGISFKPNCNPLAAMIGICTMGESFANCPETSWKNNEACNVFKQHLKVCPPESRAIPY